MSINMREMMSVIIVSSPVPSNPGTKMIQKVIKSLSLLKGLEHCNIYVALDACTDPSMQDNYDQFIVNLGKYAEKRGNMFLSVRKTHGHMAGNVRTCLEMVETKYVYIASHDFLHVQELDMTGLVEDMEACPQLKHIRFNKRANLPKRIDRDHFGEQFQAPNHVYTKTGGWSDNNHVCSTEYYRNFVIPKAPDGGTIEGPIYFEGIRSELADGSYDHQKYGTYLYGPLNNPQVLLHLDGRNSLIFEMPLWKRAIAKLRRILTGEEKLF